MFVSCHPTVPKNGPDPSKTFFLFYKNHLKITRKSLFSQFLTIFFANRIFLQFCLQNPFWQKKKKLLKKNKKIRPTYPYFFRHVTGNKDIFF